MEELDKCYQNIISAKITERKKSAEKLRELLECPKVVETLNRNSSKYLSWNNIVRNVHLYCIKEADKMQEDLKKSSCNVRKIEKDLLLFTLRKANTKVLKSEHLLRYVLECFDSHNLSRHFLDMYLLVLRDYVLLNSHSIGTIEQNQWIALLQLLLKHTNDSQKVSECLYLLIKYAPLHKLPLVRLRDQFVPITKICQQLRRSSSKGYKEMVLKMLMEFSHQNSKDCCMACCKLGEEVFPYLLELYESRTTDNTIKDLLFEYFYLQLRIHHPNGSPQGSTLAYALSWPTWRNQMTSMYLILVEEMRNYTFGSFKSNSIFNYGGEKRIEPTFCSLTIELLKQITNSVLKNENDDDTGGPSLKRARTEIGIQAVIADIQDAKSWTWINIMTELLSKYPKILQPDDFKQLIFTLRNLQSESKDADIQKHTYECLCVLVDIQDTFKDLLDVKLLEQEWSVIWETSLRSAGLNQNAKTTHKLIQKLILRGGQLVNGTQIFQGYVSGVLTVTEHSLQTLDIACRRLTHPGMVNNRDRFQEFILKWILQLEREKFSDAKAYTDAITAKVLTCCCIRKWPSEDDDEVSSSEVQQRRNWNSIEEIYAINACEHDIILPEIDNVSSSTTCTNYQVDKDMLDKLISTVKCNMLEILQSDNQDQKTYINLLNGLALICNTLSFMVKYKVIYEPQVKEICEEWQTENLISNLTTITSMEDIEERIFADIVKSLHNILTCKINSFVSNQIRQYFPTNMLTQIFNCMFDESKPGGVRLMCMDFLCNYCFAIDSGAFSELQAYALETLSTNLDVTTDINCSISFLFLKSIKLCPLDFLTPEILSRCLEILKEIFNNRCTEHDIVKTSLETMCDLIKYFVKAQSGKLQDEFLRIFMQVHNSLCSYGVTISLLVIDFVEKVIKLDPDNVFIVNVPTFLKSDYQEVRVRTIECLVTFFRGSVYSQRQDIVFDRIRDVSVEVFTVEGNLSPECQTDETVTRTASVLYTFASIMIANRCWIFESFFALLELTKDKHLNSDLIVKLLGKVSKQFGFEKLEVFLNLYFEEILIRWHSKRAIRDFPYIIFECSTEKEFYEKYLCFVVPLMIKNGDVEAINKLTQLVEKSEVEIVEDCYAKITSIHVLNMIAKPSDDDDEQHIQSYVEKMLSPAKMKQLLSSKIGNVVVDIARSVFDPKKFEEQFEFTSALLNNRNVHNYSVDLTEVLKLLQDKLNLNQTFVEYYVLSNASVIQNIMLELTVLIYEKFETQDKLRALHQYTNFIDVLITDLNVHDKFKEFAIWNVTHTLLNLVCDQFLEQQVQIAACRYLKMFCSRLLLNNVEIFECFFINMVNKLVSITELDNGTSRESLGLLHYFIVENQGTMNNIIKSLDPFPSHEKFVEINETYLRVTSSEILDLEGVIKKFVMVGNCTGNTDSRVEALKYLKTQLRERKSDLKVLYEKLNNIKGFCEDSKTSVLHQLICMLVKMTSSSNETVRIEAARCLGELGPSDLMTIILQSKDIPVDTAGAPLSFTTNCVVKLLLKYLLCSNMKLVRAASEALYNVMNTKEGKALKDAGDESLDPHEKSYLTPFVSKIGKSKINSQMGLDELAFLGSVNREDLWCSVDNHDRWIINLVCSILQCFSPKSYLDKLVSVCKIDAKFSEELLPYLIYLVLFMNKSTCTEAISIQIKNFFDKIWMQTVRNVNENTIEKRSIECVLDVVQFVWLQSGRTKNKQLTDLSLNYMQVAQAAFHCSAYFAALLYAELWCQTVISEHCNREETPLSLSVLDIVCEKETAENSQVLQTILRKSYNALGDFDAIYGCGFSYLLNSNSRMECYKHLGKWDQVILHYDIQISQGRTEYVPDLTDALENCGLYQLTLNNMNKEIEYECFWRLGQYFDDKNFQFTSQNGNRYEKFRHDALKAIYEDEDTHFLKAVTEARGTVIDSIQAVILESVTCIYDFLLKLQSIQEMEDFHEAKKSNNLMNILQKWKTQDEIGQRDFKYVEPIKMQRINMVNTLVQSGRTDVKSSLMDLCLDLSRTARLEGKFNIAKRMVEAFNVIPDVSEKYKSLKMLEDAQICWLTNDKRSGQKIVYHLLNISSNDKRLHFDLLRLYGQWMAESQSENPNKILANYLLKSLSVMQEIEEKSVQDLNDVFKTYHIVANFADVHYEKMQTYIKSTEFERKVGHKTKSKENATQLKTGLKNLNSDERRALATFERQSKIDEAEIESTYNDRNMYCNLAMKYYLYNLQYSDVNNAMVFRVISIWLNNRTNADINNLLEKSLSNISSYKFIDVLPQLVPHLSPDAQDTFERQIYNVVKRCAQDYPHHTLPIILALANSDRDDKYTEVSIKASSKDHRMQGATKLIQELKKDPHLKDVIEKMDMLSDALTELAYVVPPKTVDNKLYPIPSKCKINKIKNFNVCVPTHSMSVRRNCVYDDLVRVHSFSKEYTLVGGINVPKKISCTGSNGVTYHLLVKGKDDIRQDAVMQQVFTIMNRLLRTSRQTSKLQIRTYKIVPLSKKSGVLEWVSNSTPIGSYLVSAHEKYNKDDWTIQKCKREIAKRAKSSNEEKLRAFNDICNHCRPVLHKFFEENFRHPAVWYERRRAYTQSVATTSMCGYILGLGDRHVMNILLDVTTAEVIHIDFGIAFEQGKVLPTPETVPFRLTRDIEDGMGVSGIEGSFRRSCEKTMNVLQKNSKTITAILEVLLYDPLYTWTVTPAEAYNKQCSSTSDRINFNDEEKTPVNVLAERALLRLTQKLQGTEEGRACSIEGQVEMLIQQARDRANLSRMFAGWQSYL